MNQFIVLRIYMGVRDDRQEVRIAKKCRAAVEKLSPALGEKSGRQEFFAYSSRWLPIPDIVMNWIT